MAKKSKERELIAQAKELGYRVRRPGEYKKFTLYVHEDTLPRVKEYAKVLKYRLMEVATEALELWLEAKESEFKARKKARPATPDHPNQE